MTTVVVTSAAGGVGRPLVRNLGSSGVTVRALVKNTAQADIARQDGATEFCVGDLRDRAILADGLRGADAIYHAAPTQIIDEYPIAEALVEIGHDVSLKHVVFHSVIHPDIAELPHHQQKERVEKLLLDSGLAVTVLRPSHYMQNYLELWEFIRGGLMPYPVSPTSVMGVVDVEDVAAGAAPGRTPPPRPNSENKNI
ncbi:SDR family oxidoreductase [Nocardia wallacei]|uniref:SDR family oxidoreductase n=1 Tax=Nocardia wallacei TaxID=480035 RepID=UPI0024566F4B|nr:NmrA family NAD(P)-binding protein [Nocardia wallacei]